MVIPCVQCGFCKHVCPLYKATLNEALSPRGLAVLLKKDIDSKLFYECTLCGKCKEVCPLGFDLPSEIKNKRKQLVKSLIENDWNKEILKNIVERRNAF